MKVDFNLVVPAARAGDKKAQDKLMAEFYAWSITRARSKIRDPELAADVALDFWEWLFKKGGIEQYDCAKGTFYNWMEVCITRRAKGAAERRRPEIMYGHNTGASSGDGDVKRRKATHMQTNPAAWEGDPARYTLALETVEEVARRLRSPAQKGVFWRLIEGATVADIAQELDLSPKRVQNIIGEVRGLIRAVTGE